MYTIHLLRTSGLILLTSLLNTQETSSILKNESRFFFSDEILKYIEAFGARYHVYVYMYVYAHVRCYSLVKF